MVKILFILTTAALLVTSALGAPLIPAAQSIVTDSNIVLQGRSTNVFASNQVLLIRSISNYVAAAVASGVPTNATTTANGGTGQTNLLTGTLLMGNGTNPVAFAVPYYSLYFTNGTNLCLIGDTASPGTNYYYGTDTNGNKGFFVMPENNATPGDTVMYTNGVIVLVDQLNFVGFSMTNDGTRLHIGMPIYDFTGFSNNIKSDIASSNFVNQTKLDQTNMLILSKLTNYADTVAGNASNSAIAKASADLNSTNALLQTRLTNYVNTISNTIVLTNGILMSNYVNTISNTIVLTNGILASNYTLTIGNNNTNLSMAIGLNGTNYANTVAGNASNSAIAKASADLGSTNALLQTRLTNYVNTISNTIVLTNGILASNYTLTIGNNNTNLSMAIGLNDTNYANTVAGNASNSAIAKASADLGSTNALLQTRLTNYVNTISNTIVLTNGILASNYTLTIGNNNTNLSMAIGSNGTNYANTVGGNASNSAIAKASADLGSTNALLQTRLTNYVNTISNLISLTNGILATNFTLTVGGANTNLSMTIGLNATNYANTVAGNASNSAISYAENYILGNEILYFYGASNVTPPIAAIGAEWAQRWSFVIPSTAAAITNTISVTNTGIIGARVSATTYRQVRRGVMSVKTWAYINTTANRTMTLTYEVWAFDTVNSNMIQLGVSPSQEMTADFTPYSWEIPVMDMTFTNPVRIVSYTKCATLGGATPGSLYVASQNGYQARLELRVPNMELSDRTVQEAVTQISSSNYIMRSSFDPNFITNGLNKVALSGNLTLTNVSVTGTLDVNEISASSLSLTNPIGVAPGGTGLTNLYSGLMMGNGTNPVRFATPLYSLYFTNSTNISLVGDAAAPGNSKYYGTDISGNKGYFTLPAGGGGGGGTPLYTNSVLITASNLNFIGFPMTNDGQYLHVGVPSFTYDYTGLSNNIKADIATSNFVNQAKLDQTNLLILGKLTNYANTVAGNASNSVVGAMVSNSIPFFNNLGYLTNSALVQKFGVIGVGITPNDNNYKLNVDGTLKVASGIDITGGGGGVASPDGFSPGLSTNHAKITAAGTSGSDLSSVRIQSYQNYRNGVPTSTNNLYVSGSINSGVTNSTSGVVFSNITNILGGTTFLNGTNITNQAVASWWLISTNNLILGKLTNYADSVAANASNSAISQIISSNYVAQSKLDATNLLILGAITNATNGFSSGNNYDTDYFYTNGSSKVSLLTNLYLPFATIGTATITNSIFLDPVFTNLTVYGPLTSTNIDAKLAAASNSAMANIQSSNFLGAASTLWWGSAASARYWAPAVAYGGFLYNAAGGAAESPYWTNDIAAWSLRSTNTYTTNLYVSNLVASVASVMTLNIDAATITNFNAISATFSNVTVTNFNVVTQTVDVLVVSNLQALSVGITNSTGTNVIGKTLFTDWISLTNSGVTNVIAGGTTVSNLAIDGIITSTNLAARLGDTNRLILNTATNLAKLNVSTNGTLASAGPTNVTITFLNASTTVPASLKVINTATGAVTYALSGTMPVVLYKTNANYNLTIVSATSTNVIVGDAVWIDVQTDGATWYLRY